MDNGWFHLMLDFSNQKVLTRSKPRELKNTTSNQNIQVVNQSTSSETNQAQQEVPPGAAGLGIFDGIDVSL